MAQAAIDSDRDVRERRSHRGGDAHPSTLTISTRCRIERLGSTTIPTASCWERSPRDESRVVVQAVCRPEPTGWTGDAGDGGLLRSGTSVTDMADSLRKGRVVGWHNPWVEEPSDQQTAIAAALEEQAGKPRVQRHTPGAHDRGYGSCCQQPLPVYL